MSEMAVLIAVGPNEKELSRLEDLLTSLQFYEPGIRNIVLIDDHAVDRRLADKASAFSNGEVVSLHNPRNGKGNPYYGGLLFGLLTGMAWIERNCNPNFILKLDTDSLVTAPFVEALDVIFRMSPLTGIAGVLGSTCNRSIFGFRHELHRPSPVIKRMGLLDRPRALGDDRDNLIYRTDDAELTALDDFAEVLAHARRNGYYNHHYCQGGGYAVSKEMLSRLAAKGWLSPPSSWTNLPFGEDTLMSLLAFAVEMNLQDASDEGEPFGIQWRGLPFSPEIMTAKGYAIIHSVKNDAENSEDRIRKYFASLRQFRRTAHVPARAPDKADPSDGLHLYADAGTAETSGQDDRIRIIMYGGFAGELNFGDLIEYRSVAAAYERWGYGKPMVLLSLSDYLERTAIQTIGHTCNGSPLLFMAPRPLPEPFAAKLQLVRVGAVRGPKLLHGYGRRLWHPYWGKHYPQQYELLVRSLKPEIQVMSGLQRSSDFSPAYARCMSEHRPTLIGCRYLETVSELQKAGIKAEFSSHDGIDYLDSMLSIGEALPTDKPNIALHLSTPGHILSQTGSLNPQQIEDAREQLAQDLTTVSQRYPAPAIPLLVNSVSSYADRRDTWSVLRYLKFGALFSHFHGIDLINLALNDRLSEIKAAVDSIDRFVGTELHPVLLFRHLGVPSYLQTFNDYARAIAGGIGQEADTVEEFISLPREKILERQFSRLRQERAARVGWAEQLKEAAVARIG